MSKTESPTVVIPSFFKKPKHKGIMVGMGVKDVYVGKEPRESQHNNVQVMNKGCILNLKDFETFLIQNFEQLQIKPENYSMFFTIPSKEDKESTKNHKENLSQILFESYSISQLSLANEAEMCLFTAGRTTGLVVNLGDTYCSSTPVVDSKYLSDSITEMDLGGKDLTNYLMQILNDAGYSFKTNAEKEIVRDIKEKLCYVTLDPKKDKNKELTYELPDGNVITVKDRYKCTEALFDDTKLLS